MPQIEVTFDIDVNGVVSVSAKDLATGASQQIRIQAKGGLTQKDIDKMLSDSEKNKARDTEKRARVESRNKLESVMHELENNIEKHVASLPADEVETMKEEVKKTRDLLQHDKSTSEELGAAAKELQDKSLKLFSHVYKNAGGSAK